MKNYTVQILDADKEEIRFERVQASNQKAADNKARQIARETKASVSFECTAD